MRLNEPAIGEPLLQRIVHLLLPAACIHEGMRHTELTCAYLHTDTRITQQRADWARRKRGACRLSLASLRCFAGGSVQRPGAEPSAQPTAASSSAPIGPQAAAPARGALMPTIGAGRRLSANGASLELLINDCRKKLTAAVGDAVLSRLSI